MSAISLELFDTLASKFSMLVLISFNSAELLELLDESALISSILLLMSANCFSIVLASKLVSFLISASNDKRAIFISL